MSIEVQNKLYVQDPGKAPIGAIDCPSFQHFDRQGPWPQAVGVYELYGVHCLIFSIWGSSCHLQGGGQDIWQERRCQVHNADRLFGWQATAPIPIHMNLKRITGFFTSIWSHKGVENLSSFLLGLHLSRNWRGRPDWNRLKTKCQTFYTTLYPVFLHLPYYALLIVLLTTSWSTTAVIGNLKDSWWLALSWGPVFSLLAKNVGQVSTV